MVGVRLALYCPCAHWRAPLSANVGRQNRLMGKSSSVANLMALVVPLVLGLTLAVLIGLARTAPEVTALIALAGAILGLSLILGAKLQKFERGDYLSFGTGSDAPLQRTMYFIGYGFIALTVLVSVALLVATRAGVS